MLAPRSHRRSFRTGVRPGLAVVALVAGLALIGCGGSDGSPSADGSRLSSTPPTPPLDGVELPEDAPRVLFVGDSLVYEALVELKTRFEGGGARVAYVGAPATGLLSGTSWWIDELIDRLAEFTPDVVVFEDCCNYDGGDDGYVLADGSVVAENSEEMFDAWRNAAERAIGLAEDAGAEVHWVTTPALGDRPREELERVDRYNGIIQDLDVDLIDWRGALTPDGTFTLTVEVDGRRTVVRNRDQVHLAPAGNELVAEVTWQAVAPQLGLDPS